MSDPWIITGAFSALTSVLVGVVLMFLRGIGSDIKDLQVKSAKLEERFQSQIQQQELAVANLRVDMAKVQEQLASLLRGAMTRGRVAPIGGGAP